MENNKPLHGRHTVRTPHPTSIFIVVIIMSTLESLRSALGHYWGSQESLGVTSLTTKTGTNCLLL